MTLVLAEQPTSESPNSVNVAQTAPVLTSQLNSRYALQAKHAVLVTAWCALFLTLNYLPLQVSHLWGHVAAGQWIWQHGSLPTSDPVSALSDGMLVVDTAWLSQVVLASVESMGANALSNLMAISLLAASLILARTFYLQTGSAVLATVGTFAAWAVGWSQLPTIGPQNLGWICFASLLWLIVSSRPREQARTVRNQLGEDGRRWKQWIGIPLLMALWANLDASFAYGLMVMGCYFLGHVLETLWRTRRISAVVADRGTHAWLVLCELGLLATLCNPYGSDLLIHAFGSTAKEHIYGLAAWQPLNVTSVGGCAFVLSWIVLLIAFRHSRRPVSVAHALMLGAFAALAAVAAGTLGWYATVFGFVMVPHLSDVLIRATRHTLRKTEYKKPVTTAARWFPTLLAILAVWTTFALSGLSHGVIGGEARGLEQVLSSDTPLGVTQYLRAHPPQGQTFHPRWWGEWLATHGPTGFQAFVSSNLQLTTSHVWVDYGRIERAEPGWQRALDRYCVATVIVDQIRQPLLATVMKEADRWSLDYDDGQALVFVRGNAAEVSAAESHAETTDRTDERSSS